MAGKRVTLLYPRNAPSTFSLCAMRSTLIFAVTVAVLILTSFLFYSYTRQPNPRFATNSYARYTVPEYSFVASLEEFLKTSAPLSGSETESDGSAAAGSSKLVADPVFDERALDQSVLKVYVYDMPSKFTYDLLWLFRNTYKETENLTSNGSPVHRLIEQHSIDYWLWADLIAPESSRLLKNVIRVQHQEEADLFYIPFFTTISFFLMEKQQCKKLYREALKWVTDQPAWQRSEGRDHILPVHHPWSFKSVRRFMKKAIWLLPDMDSTGNWYKPGQVYLEKDVILPYVANVDVCDAKCLSETESQRKTLLFFRGRLKRNAGGKIRAKLVDELKNKEDIIIEEGTMGETGKKAAQDGMRRSVFCLSPAGDTPSSARLFDAIVSGCIPVIVSDELELPFEGILNYHKMAVFVSSHDALQQGWLLAHLKAIDPSKIRDMRVNLAQAVRHFLYSSPAQPSGPEDLTWRMIAGKLLNIKLHIRRFQRIVEGSRNVCTCECRVGNRTTTKLPDP